MRIVQIDTLQGLGQDDEINLALTQHEFHFKISSFELQRINNLAMKMKRAPVQFDLDIYKYIRRPNNKISVDRKMLVVTDALLLLYNAWLNHNRAQMLKC